MTAPTKAPPLFSDDEPEPDTVSSSDGAAPNGFLVTDLDEPAAADLVCEHCSAELVYSGRGPRPRFCAAHKDKRNRETTPTGTPVSSPARSRSKKKDTTAGYSMAWAGAGYLIAQKMPEPAGPPVGRLMQLQAPDAGPRLARVLGPYIDKIGFLKKLTSRGEDLGDVVALLLPPLLVGAISLELVPSPIVGPILAQLLRPMAAELLKASREQAEDLAAMGEAGEEVNAALEELLGSIFGRQAPA